MIRRCSNGRSLAISAPTRSYDIDEPRAEVIVQSVRKKGSKTTEEIL